jgi:excisionase family DNA binding protein
MPEIISGQPVSPLAQDTELLTTGQVAEVFRVDPATVTRWANTGKLSAFRTLGGHRRFRADEIRILLADAEGGGAK